MNRNRIKHIIFVIFSFLFFFTALIMFCASKQKKDSSYEFSNGKYVSMFKLKFDCNHLIGMVCGLLLLGLAIYYLYQDIKNKKVNPIFKPIVLAVLFGILSCYSGSNFFEDVIENKAKFKDVQAGFYSFIVFGVLVVYYIFDYFCKKKEEN